MTEFKFSCPHCQQHLKCDERLSGKQIECPECHHLIIIPISPTQAAQGKAAPESGRTWDTFLPPNRGPIARPSTGSKAPPPPSKDSK